MKKVDFLETTESGQQVIATITVENGQVRTLSGSNHLAESLRLAGGVTTNGRNNIQPADAGFLEALHIAFSGSMLRATKPY